MLIASQDYALRTCAYLARREGMVSSAEIAQDTGVSRMYLIQIAQQLKANGIIRSSPGKHGGYQLACDSNAITVMEIIESVREKSPSKEERPVGAECNAVEQALSMALSSMTVEDLATAASSRPEEEESLC